jgi:hypothetical protein
MYNTKTSTNTYTVIDIRKTFENCEADIRAIARRTGKWSMDYVSNLMHDILKFAENGYLDNVSIALKQNSNDYTVRATKFYVNEDGTSSDSARPGQNNDWEDINNTYLNAYLSNSAEWNALTLQQKKDFQTNHSFKFSWTPTTDDTSFSHLNSGNAQLYSSKSYEVQKVNYK